MKMDERPYLERGILKLTSFGAVFYDLNSKRHTICNNDFVKILTKCDGVRTIREIANEISTKEEVSRKTFETIKKLEEKNLVKLSKNDEESGLRIINKDNSIYPLDSVFFEATKRCNLECIHCYNPSTKTEELQTNEVLDFISEVKKLGVLKIRITGGEPFIRKDLFDILENIYSSMIDFSIFTNGTLIKKEQINRLSYLNPEFVAVSIDSINPDEYRKIRRIDNKIVLNNLEKMLSEGIRTRANIVLFKGINDFYESIRDTLNYLKDLGMKKEDIALDEVVPEGRGAKIFTYNSEERKKTMEKISRLYEEIFEEELSIKTLEGEKRKIDSYCGLGESFFYLGGDGLISLCPMLNFGDYVIGNVRSDSLRDIWEISQVFDYFRKKQHLRNTDCSGCEKFHVCGGGCKAKSLFFNGSINGLDPWMCAYFFNN